MRNAFWNETTPTIKRIVLKIVACTTILWIVGVDVESVVKEKWEMQTKTVPHKMWLHRKFNCSIRFLFLLFLYTFYLALNQTQTLMSVHFLHKIICRSNSFPSKIFLFTWFIASFAATVAVVGNVNVYIVSFHFILFRLYVVICVIYCQKSCLTTRQSIFSVVFFFFSSSFSSLD